MKKIFFVILVLLNLSGVFGQTAIVKNNPDYDDHPLHFGYTLGLNAMDFTFGRNWVKADNTDPNKYLYADVASKMLGFQVGMIVDFRLGEYFNIRCLPGFNFGQRNLSFYTTPYNNPKEALSHPDSTKLNLTLTMESSMLDFPVLIKYKAKRINNYRPYLFAGGSVRYDLAAKKKFNDDNQQYLLLKPFDCYAEMGFGIDYYLQYFKFSTEIKLSVGLLNVLNPKQDAPDHDQYVNALSKLTSNIVMISFHFE